MVIMTAKVPKRRILLVVLLLLAAAVAVMLFFLYGCMAGAAYSPRGRLVFIPLAQVSGSSTTSLFSAFIWKNRSCPPHGTMCGPI